MHNISVIHRDLKPENILRKGGSYKIGDLGFARILEFGDVTRLQVGTINFMAPEIIAGNPYNMKVDIWSLGVIFYRMIFGKLPFQFKTIGAGALINTMRNTVLDFDSRKVSKDVKSFIEGCLKVTPG
jgi:serine/threonine protein kinase